MKKYSLPNIVLVLIFGASCSKIMPKPIPENETLDGPIEGLSYDENLRFIKGDIAFNDVVFTSQTGLGPLFVSNSCGSCHAGDGKGHPFSSLIRFGQTDSSGNKFLHLGGPQLQNRALPGYAPEKLPPGATYSTIMPPANSGLGLLAALTDIQILSNTDPNDINGDGISGRVNWIVPPFYFQPNDLSQVNNGRYIGRFGKKASAIDLLHQTVNAYNQDMGITSFFNPIDTYTGLEIDPEISNQTIADVVFYLQTLKAPSPRNPEHPTFISGKSIFNAIGCSKCHIEKWTTPNNSINALSNITFYPYTDLLLHDMGHGLDDGYTEGSAYTYEWRTPPLWGLGLAKKSQGGIYFLMHDGRARTIDAAIMMHGGEAEKSKIQYSLLSPKEKNDLIFFLESL